MALPVALRGRLSLPVIGAPMFLISGPELVIAQCTSGIIGSIPSLNARPPELLDAWLRQIAAACAAHAAAHPGDPVAPHAVNLIVNKANARLEHDLEVVIANRVPVVITSLSAPDDIVPRIHAYGGIVLHDVISTRHAKRALKAGVDGLILVCAGAGGHAGTLSPFALVSEVRAFYDGLIALSGAMSTGSGILAAQAMGADLAYIGTRFIATCESNAGDAYKSMIVDASAADIVYTPLFSGVHGNYLKPSVVAAGLDPDNLPAPEPGASYRRRDDRPPAWKTIWGAGQGVGAIDAVEPVAAVVARLRSEYDAARRALAATGRKE
ncbi:MAG: NAD(P)H-dependent flavin oxidoreductase [bacterium]|nr:nitronate monooxygenase family protein [Betaproteobacteria bacterium]